MPRCNWPIENRLCVYVCAHAHFCFVLFFPVSVLFILRQKEEEHELEWVGTLGGSRKSLERRTNIIKIFYGKNVIKVFKEQVLKGFKHFRANGTT